MSARRRRPGPARSVTVEVERLILEIPVGPEAARTVGEAVESELATLLGNRGAMAGFGAGRTLPTLRAGTVALAARFDGRSFGRDLAAVLDGAIRGSDHSGRGAGEWSPAR